MHDNTNKQTLKFSEGAIDNRSTSKPIDHQSGLLLAQVKLQQLLNLLQYQHIKTFLLTAVKHCLRERILLSVRLPLVANKSCSFDLQVNKRTRPSICYVHT